MKFHTLLFLIIILGTEAAHWLQADAEDTFPVVSVIKYDKNHKKQAYLCTQHIYVCLLHI